MAKIPTWRDNFKSSCLAVGFRMQLTRAMCEFISAVADDVSWDRAVYGSSNAFPDNFIATSRSLTKRGLIERKQGAEREEGMNRPSRTSYELHSWSHGKLTPAGNAVVELLKLCGLFVEADVAVEKKARRAG